MQRELTPSEISDLLAGNEDLQSRVLQHMRIVDTGQWDQFRMNQEVSWWPWVTGTTGENLPVPTGGLVISDPKYGTVVVFPDVAGTLHFSADAPAALLQSDIGAPPYSSPTGNTMGQMFSDLQAGIGSIFAGLIVLAVVYVVVSSAVEGS